MNKTQEARSSVETALKMAIEWMEKSREAWHQIGIYDDMYDGLVSSIELCKEALEQPAQEHICGDRPAIADRQVTLQSNNIVRDKQGTIIGHLVKSRDELIEKAREEGRELEHRKQSAQEPVAWISVNDRLPDDICRAWCYVEERTDIGVSHYQWNCAYNPAHGFSEKALSGTVTHWMPLPDAPNKTNTHPAPSWQGLSDYETQEIIDNLNNPFAMIRVAEMQLKEKNHGSF